MKDQEHFEGTDLKRIHTLLSLLQREVHALELSHSQVLLVLRNLESDFELDRTFFAQWKLLLNECKKFESLYGVKLLKNSEHCQNFEPELDSSLQALFQDFVKAV